MEPEFSTFNKVLPAITKTYPSWISIPIVKTMFLTSVDQAGGENLLYLTNIQHLRDLAMSFSGQSIWIPPVQHEKQQLRQSFHISYLPAKVSYEMAHILLQELKLRRKPPWEQ